MKRTVMSSLLVTAILAGAVAPAMAEERRPPPAQGGDHSARPDDHEGKGGDKDHDRRKGGRPFGHGMGGNPGLKLAQRLSGLETYIGITPEQAPAWRGYTDALIAFAEADMPPPGARPKNGPEGAPGTDHPAQPPRLMAEMIAERAIAKGGKAENLKVAAATLRASLSAEQLARLIGAEAPPKGPHGPAGGPDMPPPPGQPAP